MWTVAALALALTAPTGELALAAPMSGAPRLLPSLALQLQQEGEEGPAPVDSEALSEERLAHLLSTRATMSDWMRGLGTAAFVSMAVTNVIAALHFHDLYAFQGSYEETPCARGGAILPEYCEGTLWPHAIASGVTTTFYVTTAMLGMFMPDPLGYGDQPGPRGERIRLHRTLRIVTSTLVIVHALLGVLIRHSDVVGLDRRQDYDAMHGLSIAQLTLGWAAVISLGAQGAVMTF